MEIEKELIRLKRVVSAKEFSIDEFRTVAETILIWLNENNTDENCRMVDIFVSTQIEFDERKRLPEVVQGILFDMGGALHDTHTAPEVARNFESTPEQLLERVRRL